MPDFARNNFIFPKFSLYIFLTICYNTEQYKPCGGVAQLGERTVRIRKVESSILFVSTTSEQSSFDSVSAFWRKHPSSPLLFLLPKKPKAFRGARKPDGKVRIAKYACSTTSKSPVFKCRAFFKQYFTEVIPLKTKYMIIAALAIICSAILLYAFVSPAADRLQTEKNLTEPLTTETAEEKAPEDTPIKEAEKPVEPTGADIEKKTEEKEQPQEAAPAASEKAEAPSEAHKGPSCTLSVRCDSIFKSEHKPSPETLALLPEDGIILPECEVSLNDGDTAFDVLLRELKKRKIHLEFENTPMYNSSYVEGISNLYEFDCGELSGWLFSVNGEFFGQGSSSLRLKDGDTVLWVYSCDLGRDVGGYVLGAE